MENDNSKEKEMTPIITITPTPSKPEPEPEPNPEHKFKPDHSLRRRVIAPLVIVLSVMSVLIWKGAQQGVAPAVEEVPIQKPAQVNPDELFAELDEQLAESKRLAVVDAELVNAMETLDDVIRQLVRKADEAGDLGLATDRVVDAYSVYVSAVYNHKDMLDGLALSGAIYRQIMLELDEAVLLGNSLIENGYDVEISSLLADQEVFKTAYTDRIISSFDEFTERPMWSRTEAWNLMSDTADNMFESSDLDNPVRLRYAYALSWWVQKQIETELNNGTITAKGAAIKIANMIETMDYSPMMIQAYITFMSEAGEDCTEVSNAYNEIVEHLHQTQGIRIGKDIDLAHFWYFNDFITHSVDDMNGVTQENRQWIRGRMGYVTFVKE
jgi:hypothetical protein